MQDSRHRIFEMLLRLGIVMSMIYVSNGEELLELSCFNDKSCKQYQLPGVLATCVDNKCKCRESENGGQRVPCQPAVFKKSNFIGGQCPCTQPYAECNQAQEICYCAVGYMPSNDLRRCLKIDVSLDGACEVDIQCQVHDAFAICETEKKVCKCRTGYQQWEGMCAARLGLVSPRCESDIECQAFSTAAKCAGTSGCLCNFGFVSATNMSACLPQVELNAACKMSTQCQSSLGAGGLCLHGRCSCEEMYDAQPLSTNRSKMVCAHKLVLGKYCRSDEQCLDHFSTEQTMICDYGQCNCRDGYIRSENGIQCRRSNALKPKVTCWWLLILIPSLIYTRIW